MLFTWSPGPPLARPACAPLLRVLSTSTHSGALWALTYFRLAFDHLFFCAAAILARPSVLFVLRFLAGSLDRIPRLSGAAWPVSSARIFSKPRIAASRLRTMGSRSMV
jgi:hypothetical protein